MLRQLKHHARCSHPLRFARLDCAPHQCPMHPCGAACKPRVHGV
jgi:hypothetical protein